MLAIRNLALTLLLTLPLVTAEQKFAGTWEGKFKDTVIFVLKIDVADEIAGTLLMPMSIRVDEDGNLVEAEPSRTGKPFPIQNAKLEGNRITFDCQDDNETVKFELTITGDAASELRFLDPEASKMKPIALKRT
jgi:hypothetical protein